MARHVVWQTEAQMGNHATDVDYVFTGIGLQL